MLAQVENCFAVGRAPAIGPNVYEFYLNMEVDIGWRMFTVARLDRGADQAGCFGALKQAGTYPLGGCGYSYEVRCALGYSQSVVSPLLRGRQNLSQEPFTGLL